MTTIDNGRAVARSRASRRLRNLVCLTVVAGGIAWRMLARGTITATPGGSRLAAR
jgi:hypothetical protein